MNNISDDETRSEYDLDYAKAKPNRFAERAAFVVTLRDDLATYLQARASAKGLSLGDLVNDMLRREIELIEAVK
jgi:hypothetical protein